MSMSERLLAATFDDAYRQAQRDADEADAASARARARLLAYGSGDQASDWPGYVGGGSAGGGATRADNAHALAAALRAGADGARAAGHPGADAGTRASAAAAGSASFAPTSSELALASLLVATPPRAILRSGPSATDDDELRDLPSGAPRGQHAIVDRGRPAASGGIGPSVGLGATVSAAAGMGPDSGRRGGACVDLYELDPKVRWWRVDNAYIYFGYRKPHPAKQSQRQAVWAALCTLFYPVHNQTANVWTHLLGAGFVAWLLAETLGADGPMRAGAPHGFRASTLDLCAMGGFLSGALICLLLSAAFHLLSDTSLRVRRFMIKLDFAGVLCLVWGSWLPLLQFGLACRDVRWRIAYIAVITAGVLTVAVLCLLPRFATPGYQPVRAGVFLFIGWVGAVPAVQLLIDRRTRPIGLGIIKMGLLYSVGTALDVFRVPERFFYAAAPPSVLLSAVGGAKGGGDDGVRSSNAQLSASAASHLGGSFRAGSRSASVGAALGEGGAQGSAAWVQEGHSGPPSPSRGHSGSRSGAVHAMESGGAGDASGGCGAGHGSHGSLSTTAATAGGSSFGGGGGVRNGGGSSSRLMQLPLQPNTVTATILSSGSALDLVASGPVDSAIEAELCELAAQEAEEEDAQGRPPPQQQMPPHLTSPPSLLDHVRAAERNARAHLGACAPLLCIWGSHATFHCFVVAAVLTHYETSMTAWDFKTTFCAP